MNIEASGGQSGDAASGDAPVPGGIVERAGWILGPAALVAWLFVPRGELGFEAHRLAGVLMFAVIWWVTEPIPIAATGLAAVVLCVVLGAVPPGENGKPDAARIALAPFADPSVFFLLGGVFIGRAMTRHGLDRRLALSILCTRWAARSPTTVLAAVGLSVMLTSMWISNTAATAMMFPVTVGIISVLARGSGQDRFERSPYATSLLLITAFASCVGGIATPIGTATNVVAMGYFRRPEYFGQSADFFRWTLAGVPMMIAIFVGLFLLLRFHASHSTLAMESLRAYLVGERQKLGPWRRGEFNTLVVFLVVVSLWILPGLLALAVPNAQGLADRSSEAVPSRGVELLARFREHFPEEITALLAPVLLFLLPVDWSRREFTLRGEDWSRIDWGTLLLFGSGLSLGNLMFKTGLAKSIAGVTVASLGEPGLWTMTAIGVISGILLSEFMGNAAAASTLIPVMHALAKEAGVDPTPPLLGVTLGASFGSALPVSTPPNAIVYSSGLIPVRRMVLAGVGLDLLACCVIVVTLWIAFHLGWTPFLTGGQ